MFFDRHEGGERVALVHIDFDLRATTSGVIANEDFHEFQLLAESSGVEAVATVRGSRHSPHPKAFLGAGKIDEIKQLVDEQCLDAVLFNHALSPSQERNLEKALCCRVVDRTGLILDIFAQRARTFEGKLQVELAQLEHLSTRLVRGWTHLERQKGGIGLRGPGETQLETDRRLLRVRIRSIHQRLEKVRKQREQGRRARKRAELPTVSVVGYTNAGKSTLFNRMVSSDVYAADQLFATLDPTLRRLELPDVGKVILADTVGFVRHLPHKLVEAFRATLDETRDADLLLHVVDVAAADFEETMDAVNEVLKDVGAESVPQIVVFNKIDLLGAAPKVEYCEGRLLSRVWLSARTGDGLDVLKAAMAKALLGDGVNEELVLQPAQGQLRAQLYEAGGVDSESVDNSGCWHLQVKMPKGRFHQLLKQHGLQPKTP